MDKFEEKCARAERLAKRRDDKGRWPRRTKDQKKHSARKEARYERTA